ncbi:MAG: GNAT family N-acetyltransferase [Promethearchaeota archaeon]|nr:MAG: GNAT family N-acetyltransferase [Candidatus Lokiarchaeota archaeon]
MIEDLEIIEEINDKNLFLRKISKSDAEFFLSSLNEKDITNYLSLGPLRTIEHSKRLIRNYLKYWENYLQFNYIIELQEQNRLKIGSVSLWNVNWQHHRAQMGIWLIPSFWHKGLAEISLNLIKNIAFIHLKLNRLEAYIALENKRSISLFEKCGFKEEGILRQYLNFQGNYHNAKILACLKNEIN